MVTSDACYVGTGSWLTTTGTPCNCTCQNYYLIKDIGASSGWLTTSNFKEYMPIGFYHNGHFFKNKKELLNYKSALESKETCIFLRKILSVRTYLGHRFYLPMTRKTQYRGPSLKIRSEQKRKMRLHKK